MSIIRLFLVTIDLGYLILLLLYYKSFYCQFISNNIEHSESFSGVRSTNFKVSLDQYLFRRYGYNVTIRSIDYNFRNGRLLFRRLILLFLSACFIHCKSCICRGSVKRKQNVVYKDIFANSDCQLTFQNLKCIIKVTYNI